MSLFIVFFKQKTAYEMRISDWSSDVCSSDLQGLGIRDWGFVGAASPGVRRRGPVMVRGVAARAFQIPNPESPIPAPSKLRAAGRARVGDRVADVGQPAHVHPQPLERSEEQKSEITSLMSISYCVFCFT